jgi:TRAP-type transport system small permease protein
MMEKLETISKQGEMERAVSSASAIGSPKGVLKWVAHNVEEIICAFFLTVLVVTISAAVTFRYVVNSPLPWPEELARYSSVWLTFVGASLATKRNTHIVVDYAALVLPKGSRLWVALAVQSIVIAFLVLFVVQGVAVVQRMWVAVSPALSIRLGYVYLAIPVGAGLMIVHTLRATGDTVRALWTGGGA